MYYLPDLQQAKNFTAQFLRMGRLFDVLNRITFLFGVTPRIGQVHLTKCASADFTLNNERFAQLPERFILYRALCRNTGAATATEKRGKRLKTRNSKS